jgi:uncharacterized protein
MKFLLMLVVVGLGLWMFSKRVRGSGSQSGAGKAAQADKPTVMVECAHCGLHLPAQDAVPEGSRLYCSEAHQRLGPSGKSSA